MKECRTLVLSFAAFLGGWAASIEAQTVAEKGQLTIGTHEFTMKAGNLYAIKVEAKDFHPRVMMKPGSLGFGSQDFAKPNQYQTYYFPTKDETNTIFVAPDLFNLKGKGPFDYSIEVTPMRLAAKPMLEVKGELTGGDPAFKADFSNRAHHKTHDIKLDAGRHYIIDMTSPPGGNRLDSFLYLLDSKGKILRADDDGGGYPNARIVFQAEQAGDYRIITTGLGNALGQFNLTVRGVEKE